MTPHEAIMQEAFAKIEAMNAEFAAREARINADPRIRFCRAEVARCTQPITFGGMAGGMQMFIGLWSPEHARKLQARALLCARIGQLDGNHSRIRTELSKAAACRREAKARTLNSQIEEAA